MSNEYKYFQELQQNKNVLLVNMIEAFKESHKYIKDIDKYFEITISADGLLTVLDRLYTNYIIYLKNLVPETLMSTVIDQLHKITSIDKNNLEDRLQDNLQFGLECLTADEYNKIRQMAWMVCHEAI